MDHIRDLIEAVAKAKRDAYATAPRDNNDHFDAAMFIAMANAYNTWINYPDERENPPEPETLAPEVVGPLPPPVTEDELTTARKKANT